VAKLMVGVKMAIVPGCLGDELGRVVQNIFGGQSFRSDIVAERGCSTADLVQRLGFQIARLARAKSAAGGFSHVPNLGNRCRVARVGQTRWDDKTGCSCWT
jgi:hypothetical protein